MEELEIIRDSCNTLRQKSMLEFFYSTGCRLEEIELLNKHDIDWQNLKVRVIGKGNKEGVVYINSKAKIHLQKYLVNRSDSCEALFITERKPYVRLSRRSYEREFNKLGKIAKLNKSIYPHLIRHTTATHLLNAGADLMTVKLY